MEVETGLRDALKVVGPVFERHGFELRSVRTGSGSGGAYAVGVYARGLWRANVYYRDGHLEQGWYRHAWREVPHSSLVPRDNRTGYVSPAEYARQVESYIDDVLTGDWRAFRRRARRSQREYDREMRS